MTELVFREEAPAGAALLTGGYQATVAMIQANGNTEGAIAAAQNLSDLRAWMKIKKSATDQRLRAVQLECWALRRVAELDGLDGLDPKEREIARKLASIPIEKFPDLIELAKVSSSPSSMFNDHASQVAREAFRRLLPVKTKARVEGRLVVDEGSGRAVESMKNSAEIILQDLAQGSSPFTVSEVADRIIEEIPDPVARNWAGGVAREAVKEAVRGALRAGVATDSEGATYRADDWAKAYDEGTGDEYPLPLIVTYSDDEAGFLRFPRPIARLAHLEAMSRYRRKQADEMAAAACEMEALVSCLRGQMAPGEDGTTHIVVLAARSSGVKPGDLKVAV